jgi:hypothetical protein
VFQGLHRWLDSWREIGDLVTGMKRQAYDLGETPWLAVQRAAARALDRTIYPT